LTRAGRGSSMGRLGLFGDAEGRVKKACRDGYKSAIHGTGKQWEGDEMREGSAGKEERKKKSFHAKVGRKVKELWKKGGEGGEMKHEVLFYRNRGKKLKRKIRTKNKHSNSPFSMQTRLDENSKEKS